MNLDNYATQIFDDNKNMMVPWYLMASYAYYKEDDPILSDAIFDDMGKKLLENWDNITHFHKEYITKDELVAGNKRFLNIIVQTFFVIRKEMNLLERNGKKNIREKLAPFYLKLKLIMLSMILIPTILDCNIFTTFY